MKARPQTALVILPAAWPGDTQPVRDLLRRYFEFLRQNPASPLEVCTRDRDEELNGLADRYDGSSNAMLLAWFGKELCGCVVARILSNRPNAAEMKRLYVTPEMRGLGVGRMLVEAAIAWSREHVAQELLLDTLPEAMPDAVRLYHALGFEPTERYNANTGAGFAFFRLPLG